MFGTAPAEAGAEAPAGALPKRLLILLKSGIVFCSLAYRIKMEKRDYYYW